MSVPEKRFERTLNKIRALHTDAEAADRDLTTEERARYDDLMGQATRAATEAEREASLYAQLRVLSGGSAETRAIADGSGRPSLLSPEHRAGTSPTDHAVLVPTWGEYRAQAESVDSAGGFTTPVEQSAIVVDRLRPQSVFLKAGPRIFTMNSDVLRVPKIATSTTVAMVSENAEIVASDLTFAAATFTAKKLAGLTRASNEWLSDGVPDSRLLVERDLLAQMGQLLDQQLFAGSGVSPSILGLINTPGVTSTAIGGPLTLDAVSQAIQRLQVNNATPSAIFVSPSVWGSVQRQKDGDARYMLRPDPSMDTRQQLFGVEVFVTPTIGDVAIVADMSQVGVGVRDRWTVHYDPFRYSEFDQSAIRVTSRWDAAVLNPAGVELLTGVS